MKELYILVAVFCVLQWLDVWTTGSVIDNGGEEFNPFIIIDHLKGYKAICCAVVFLAIVFFGRSGVVAPILSRALWFLDGWFGAVVFGNFLALRKLRR